MEIGIVGLGRMGGNIARRLMQAGHRAVVWDKDAAAVAALTAEGAVGVTDLAGLVGALKTPRAVWVMLPHGAPTEDALEQLGGLLAPGDTAIDGGNTHWKDDIRRAKVLAARGIDYLDIGTSGGVWGLKPEALDCRIKDNGDSIDVIYSEEYGDNSMCFDTTSGEGRCYTARCIYEDFNLQLQVDGRWYTCQDDFQQIEVSTLSGAFGTTVTCPRLSSVCPDMFCPGNCAGRGTCVFDHTDGDGIPRPKCQCFDETDKSAGCSDSFVLDGKYLKDGTGLSDTIQSNFFEPLIAVFVDHPDTWTTASWAWAAALFVVFLLMILCICSSFWPEKEKTKKRGQHRYAV